MAVVVRVAAPKDLASLRDIERAAGQLFAEIGMDEIASDEPPSLDALSRYSDTGHAWVLVDDQDSPVGFALVDVVDGCAHIEQLSIHPRHHRHGYGRMLIHQIATWAQDRGMPAVTLTTFRDVVWQLHPRELVFKECSVVGSRYASRAELMDAGRLVASGTVRPVVGAAVAPREVGHLHAQLRAGTLRGRGALVWK